MQNVCLFFLKPKSAVSQCSAPRGALSLAQMWAYLAHLTSRELLKPLPAAMAFAGVGTGRIPPGSTPTIGLISGENNSET